MAESGVDDWREGLASAEARVRVTAQRALGDLLRSAAAKIPVTADVGPAGELAGLGLTAGEIAAVLSDTRQAANFRGGRAAEVARQQLAVAPPCAPRRLSRPRIGPRMRQIQMYASCCPGESVTSVLTACGIPTHRSSYRAAIYRAEAAGLIVIERVRLNLYRVFGTERDKKIFYLRRELLAAGTSADRVAALRAEIDALRAEQARTWIDPPSRAA